MALVKKVESVSDQVVQETVLDFDVLEHKLQSANPTERCAAVEDLALYPQASGLLVFQLEHELDTVVRERLFSSLIRLADDVAIKGLIACLRSDDAALRNEAIEALKQMPQEVGPVFSDLLHDADPDVRIFAVNILESLRHPLVEQWLVDVITKDPHVNVCATAVDLLGEVGDQLAAAGLLSLKQRFPDEPYIQFAADLALKRINEA